MSTMKPPEIINTLRLQLRKPARADAEAIFANYAQDEEVTRYLTWQPHKTIEDTHAYLKHCIQGWEQGKTFPWVIVKNNNKQLIGAIEFSMADYKAELGYVLAKAAWGQGYMTEAAKAAMKWFQAQENIYRIWAVCKIENRSSAKVLEKLGMQFEVILHRWNKQTISPEPVDCCCYAWCK